MAMYKYMETTTLLLIVTALLIRYGTAEKCNKEQNSLDGHNLHLSYMMRMEGDFDVETVTDDEPEKIKHEATLRDKKIVETLKKAKAVEPELAHPKAEDSDNLYNEVMLNGKEENEKKVKDELKSTGKSSMVSHKADVKEEGKTIGSMAYLTKIVAGRKVYEKATYTKFDATKTGEEKPKVVLAHRRQTNYQENEEKIKSYSIGTSHMDIKDNTILTTIFESVMHNQAGEVNKECPKVRSLFTAVKMPEKEAANDMNAM